MDNENITNIYSPMDMEILQKYTHPWAMDNENFTNIHSPTDIIILI